ncbi:MAG: NADH-quinone oxidoreductase subunit NuoE [Bacillota bacterium]
MPCNCNEQNQRIDKYLQPVYSILSDYPAEEKSLIPVLQKAQEEYGYLPEDVLKEVALKLGLSLSQIYGVVTFYTQFHLEPRGENIIRVCTGTACHVRGASEVLNTLEAELGVKSGETTEDLKFTLETVACIGACGLAPVIMVNDNTHGRLTSETTREVIQQYN